MQHFSLQESDHVLNCSSMESDGVSSDDDDEHKFDPLLLKLHMHNIISGRSL